MFTDGRSCGGFFKKQKIVPLLLLLLIIAFPSFTKQRVIILTDISPAAQEPDDLESMIRLLLYSNEIDIEGLIATSSCWRSKDPLRPDLIVEVVNAYGQVQPNLLKHAPGYPEKQRLLDVIKTGNGHSMESVGNGKTSPGSRLIIDAALRNDNRPLWICIWGGAATLAQTFYDLKNSYTPSQLDTIVSKLRVYDLSGQDDAGAWICHTFPDVFYVRSQFQWRGFSYRLDNLWQESRGGDEALVSPEWFSEHIIKNHGVYGALYPKAKYLHEGDSPTFLNLISNGLSSEPENINFGGWGGRFGITKKKNVRTGSENSTITESNYDDYWMYTDAPDLWHYNDKLYNNSYCVLYRWRSACQNDFAARMDWCIEKYGDANHHPIAVVNGNKGSDFIRISAVAGSTVEFDASGSSDPDNDHLNFEWRIYREAGTYNGIVVISDSNSVKTRVQIPPESRGKTVHLICAVSDDGLPNLHAYRRIIISCSMSDSVRVFMCDKNRNKSNAIHPECFSLCGRRIDHGFSISVENNIPLQTGMQKIAPGVYLKKAEGYRRYAIIRNFR